MRDPLDLLSSGRLKEIESRAFWSLLVVLGAAASYCIGLPTLLLFTVAKLSHQETRTPSLALFDYALATVVVALIIAGILDSGIKRRLGRLVLATLSKALSFLGGMADWIIRKRLWTGALGWMALAVSVLSSIYLADLNVRAQENRERRNRHVEVYNTAVRDLIRFVESEPFGATTQAAAATLIGRFENSREMSGAKDECDALLAQSICKVYSACAGSASLNDQTLHANVASLLKDNDQRMSEEQAVSCKGKRLSAVFLDAWLARLQLISSNQGTVLSTVVEAHKNLLRARRQLNKLKRQSPIIENALGNVYVYYLSRYVDLYGEYSWDSALNPPLHQRGEMRVARSELINQATRAMERARSLEPNTSYAASRYANNINDLKLRLVPLIILSSNERFNAIETSSIASGEIRTAIKGIRANPITWITEAKRSLLRDLQDKPLPEGFITYAQLASLELTLDENAEHVYGAPYLSLSPPWQLH